MTTQSRGNWLDKLTTFVPGYKGYKDQPQRRTTDRLLRDSITKRLTDGKVALDRAVADAINRGEQGWTTQLNQMKESLDALITEVKTVPPGYSGLFEAFTIETTMVYRLYRYDLAIRDRTEEVVILMGGLVSAKNQADTLAQVKASLQLVTEALHSRNQAVGEIR